MRVLVGCETSGVVRRAFDALGHDAWSCDLLPADDGSNRHIVGDVRDLLGDDWDLLAVMHPPCTRLCNSGVRWLNDPVQKNPPDEASPAEKLAWAGLSIDERRVIMHRLLDEGAALFSDCWNAPIARVAVENPVMHRYAKERIRNYQQPAQTVQPWWFGDPAFKATSFYLRGLPKLAAATRLTPPASGTEEHKQWSKVHRATPGPDRWKLRSVTYPGIAAAMAEQWGGHAMQEAAE
ncbi:hypothetical protein LAC81_15130 [Ensifer adhaerens]|uniref:hypothetical protein n=1 Tax=Ensifer adhaerens TaxID=106592 RepID=UPI001CC1A908|nr:hypothetical protein [Ensifer adhaerens]MBZ7923123.1 hypothetical protein [Ensifer adhaerens]UAX91713.1 hypothetical protein LAC78_15125 [Ensifer adhaerens]UAX99341.1 hypothetical protein LAC80_15130 [Ensifer adhaerens]UAY06724.1 hypothetical protein LAC81_15130 [Ensifer adhaerens]